MELNLRQFTAVTCLKISSEFYINKDAWDNILLSQNHYANRKSYWSNLSQQVQIWITTLYPAENNFN